MVLSSALVFSALITTQNSIEAQTRTIAEVDSDLADLSTNFTVLESSLTRTEGDVTLLRSDLTLAENKATRNTADIRTSENDITALQLSKRDYNPMINQYDNVFTIPPTPRNSDVGTSVALNCGDGISEIPIGFSYEFGDVKKIEQISFKAFQFGLDSPFFNEFNIEVYNSGTTPVDMEFFINCAMIDVNP